MSEKTRGRLYVAVCIACLITCAVLIGSIFFQNKQNAGQQTEIHRPRMDQMTTQQGEGGMQGMGETLITEEYAAGMLKKCCRPICLWKMCGWRSAATGWWP